MAKPKRKGKPRASSTKANEVPLVKKKFIVAKANDMLEHTEFASNQKMQFFQKLSGNNIGQFKSFTFKHEDKFKTFLQQSAEKKKDSAKAKLEKEEESKSHVAKEPLDVKLEELSNKESKEELPKTPRKKKAKTKSTDNHSDSGNNLPALSAPKESLGGKELKHESLPDVCVWQAFCKR